jgi:hypothetical protein
VSADDASYEMRPAADDRFVAVDDPDITLEFPADGVCTLRCPLFWITAYRGG